MKLFAGIVLSAIFFLSVLTSSFYSIAVNKAFYAYEYKKNGTYSEFDKKEVDAITNALVKYLSGSTEVLYYESGGDNIFTHRESEHMADVKALFQRFIGLRNWMLAAAAIMVFALRRDLKAALSYFHGGLIFCMTAFAVLSGVAAANYEYYFTLFHKVFFTNDYWLLDPADSIIINLMPIGFFEDAALAIFVSTLAVCAIAVFFARKLIGKINHKTRSST